MNNNKMYAIRMVVAIVVLVAAILGLLGIFYPAKIFDIQFVPLSQRLFVSSVAAVLFVALILLTIAFGRIYCSTLCPFGILQEMVSLIFKRRNMFQKKYPTKYFIAAVVFGILIGGSTLAIRYLEPYTYFGSLMTFSAIGIIAFILVLNLLFFKNRLFCTNICPVGTVLGLISKLSLNKIYIEKDMCIQCGRCAKSCSSGCIDVKEKTVDNEACIKCLKCLGECKSGVIKFGKTSQKNVPFSPKRREIITAVSVIALFGGMIKTGIVLKDKIVQTLKDVILPPGAESEERLINKCLNCNLCVANCPKKIIIKADKNFGAVHLDYTKNHCDSNCNKCGEVCPANAIKRLSLEEKQKTRIAMAIINEDKCSKCGICIKACPYEAIIRGSGKSPMIDASKCVGCGACYNVCDFNAISIFAVKKQTTI